MWSSETGHKNADVLKAIRLRCECGGPIAILSTPPGGVSYGTCLCCGQWSTVTARPQSVDAVDPHAADPGTPTPRVEKG